MDTSLLRYLNPFTLVRESIRIQDAFISNLFWGFVRKTDERLASIKEFLYRLALFLIFSSFFLWMSVLMYVAFYSIYMPNVTHVRPVHLQFKPCEDKAGICSYPYAYVQLTKASNLLMSKQPYRIYLELEMPESRVNKDLGMFMVCVQMRAKGGYLVSSSCRSAMLRYRSFLHHTLRTLFFSPLYLGGVEEEKQQLQVELFSDFEDDSEKPATDAYIELQSRYAEVYSSGLHVHAHFSGLRYFMFHWPTLSAMFGICVNLAFLMQIFVLSWYHLQDGLPDFLKHKLRFGLKSEVDDKQLIGKVKLEREDSTTFFEEDALLKEFQQIETKAKEEPKKT